MQLVGRLPGMPGMPSAGPRRSPARVPMKKKTGCSPWRGGCKPRGPTGLWLPSWQSSGHSGRCHCELYSSTVQPLTPETRRFWLWTWCRVLSYFLSFLCYSSARSFGGEDFAQSCSPPLLQWRGQPGRQTWARSFPCHLNLLENRVLHRDQARCTVWVARRLLLLLPGA